jgi:phage tail sheath protein FI
MPVTPTYPGVYIEEIPSGVRTITGVATSITAFIGRAQRGPVDEPVTINSFGDFERVFGGLWQKSKLGFAVRDFYLNGGSQAVIVRLYHPSYTEEERSKALKAAQTVADEVTKASKNAETDPNVTVNSVKTAAQQKADSILNNSPLPEEKSAVTFFMNAIESAPPGTTANCISNVARKKADEFDKSPTSDSADRVSNAARDKAAENGASIDDVAIAARDEATKIGNEGVLKKTAADETAKAA